MAGPKYTVAQTRARVAALEIAAAHLDSRDPEDTISDYQRNDLIIKLRNEAIRLKQKAQQVRRDR